MPERERDETTKGPYWLANEVERVVDDLVERQCVFPDLQGVPITCLFTDKDMKKGGRNVAAKIKKASDLEIALVERLREEISEAQHLPAGAGRKAPVYIIIVDAAMWLDFSDAHALADGRVVNQREALVYHELQHAVVRRNERKDTVTYGLREHDFTGFVEEVAKYGAWHYVLGNAERAMRTGHVDRPDEGSAGAADA